MDNDISEDQNLDSVASNPRQAGCFFGLLLIPVILIFHYNGIAARGYLVTFTAVVLCLVAYQTRDVAKEDFYFGIVPPLFLIQLLCAIFIPLPEGKFTSAFAMPLIIAALVFNFTIIRWSQRIFGSKK